MNKIFYPKKRYKTIYDINLEELYEDNIRGIILDIDNTLVGHGIIEINDRLENWIEGAKAKGFQLCIASNNTEDRVVKFTENLKIQAIYRASKPRKGAFLKAASVIGVLPSQIAVIGDQIFTDILGGNRLGMTTILVDPVDSKEPAFIKLKRVFEKLVLISYKDN